MSITVSSFSAHPAPVSPVGLVAHSGKERAADLLAHLLCELRAAGVEVRLETATAALVGEPDGGPVAALGRACALIIVLGGDGTLLSVVHELGEHLCPLFGINLGSLGFLTCVGSADVAKAVEAIRTGRYVLSQRSLLDVTLERSGQPVARRTALNEAVVSRGAVSRLIKIDTRIDGTALTQFNADGLIVATPTGSTAYSLSAGGPLIAPDAGVFTITPVCPHVLTNRSLVVAERSEITLQLEGHVSEAILTVDGLRPLPLEKSDIVRIKKSPLFLPLATLKGLSFCEVLREKLKWSGSAV